EFAGRVPPEEMPDFMRSIDLLVVPSLWPENLPIIILEASAAGVPVIASDVGGISEMIADKRFLFAPGSVEGLAACLRTGRSGAAAPTFPRVSMAEEMCAATERVYEHPVFRSAATDPLRS